MARDKNKSKQWCDIWIEEDGVHMLKIAYDSIFKEKAPDYIKNDYVIKFENIKKIRKLDYDNKCVMLAKLENCSEMVEIPVATFEERNILKKNLLLKTTGVKRKTLLMIAGVILVFMLASVNYTKLFKDIKESAKHVNLQRASIEYNINK